MEKKVMLLQIWTEDDTLFDGGKWKDLYFNVDIIDGWFIADDVNDFGAAINILFKGDMITVKQEPHIVEFLKEKFVNPAISARTK